jgi:hypothetical protein
MFFVKCFHLGISPTTISREEEKCRKKLTNVLVDATDMLIIAMALVVAIKIVVVTHTQSILNGLQE